MPTRIVKAIDPGYVLMSTIPLRNDSVLVKIFYNFYKSPSPPMMRELEELNQILPLLRERIEGEMTEVFQKLERELMDDLAMRGDPLYTLSMNLPSFEFDMCNEVEWDMQKRMVFVHGQARFKNLNMIDVMFKVNQLGYSKGFFHSGVLLE